MQTDNAWNSRMTFTALTPQLLTQSATCPKAVHTFLYISIPNMFSVPFGVRSHSNVFVLDGTTEQRERRTVHLRCSDETNAHHSCEWYTYILSYIVRNAVVYSTKYMADGYIDHHHHIGDWLTWLFLANAMSVSFRNFTIFNTDNIIFMCSCRFTSNVYCCNIACKTTDNVNKKKKEKGDADRPLFLVRMWCNAFTRFTVTSTHTRMHLCTNILLRCALLKEQNVWLRPHQNAWRFRYCLKRGNCRLLFHL